MWYYLGGINQMKKEVDIVKIKWIEFENLETGLKIERINFYDDMTLLVGLSGAGKTQILKAIEFSLRLALDDIYIFSPYNVSIGFSIDEHFYEWSYTLKKQETNQIVFRSDDEFYFVRESLMCDQKKLFTRYEDSIEIEGFDNIPTPKKDKSLIYQYSDDLHFNELVSGLKKLYSIDMEYDVRRYLRRDDVSHLKSRINKTFKEKPDATFESFSHLPSLAKLYIVRNHYKKVFDKILYSVQEIFPEIEDIDFVEEPNSDWYCVQIVVYGKKIYQDFISNGMLKTIFFIIQLYTATNYSLIMIDEFENGLGINCIDSISELIINERSDLQFIITSHHPKIIGNIDYNCWKIIEREKNVIKNFDCHDKGYEIGGNHHDAYYNLLNKWEFEGKI